MAIRASVLILGLLWLATPAAADHFLQHAEERDCMATAAGVGLYRTCEVYLDHQAQRLSCDEEACDIRHACTFTLYREQATAKASCDGVARDLATPPLGSMDVAHEWRIVRVPRGECATFTASAAGYGPRVAGAPLGETGEFSHAITLCAPAR